MNSESRTLPDFAKPPVVETVLDVGFSPLAQWGIPHFGLFWQSIRDDYPTFKDQPPVLLQRESFGEAPAQRLNLAFDILNQPEARCWFEERSGARLIQIQHDRFIHNWRKTEEQQEYPHYEQVIRPAFSKEWDRFCSFLHQQGISQPEVQQCEVQYVNHIDFNGWESFTSLVDALGEWPGGRGYLPRPESIVFNTSYLMPENAGRLRIVVQPAVRNNDGKRVIQLSLIARGRPSSSTREDILAWFDLGRNWIVNGFTEFSSTKMHQTWESIR
ncbi:MAG TPA: TIGR04255 family protein [Pyrinomonadaceae bacterium]|jgi:uncharacterized protein (TIGR04255 family)|nr:TIGR04255 family protein [Pyrinomonadaceae bacterium]